MYAWIWRKLPFGLGGKLGGSLVLLGVIGALLWYVIFPWAEPLLPFDDVQVGDPDSGYSQLDEPAADPSGTPEPGDGHDIPYDTGETPVPSPSNR
ncbi:hypothetical protein [Catellatospora methionotrophica]|uniref:hypothetical protein n=1 Tax=Catellatospora methionotrophica TaxID=121620 RepID=UPI0033DBFC45